MQAQGGIECGHAEKTVGALWQEGQWGGGGGVGAGGGGGCQDPGGQNHDWGDTGGVGKEGMLKD